MKTPRLFAIVLVALLFGGCAKPPQTGKGFYLPAGDGAHGKVVFVQQKCHTCHTVRGVELPKPDHPAAAMVALGGEVAHLRSYGDLVTAVINPNHGISDLVPIASRRVMKKSPMPDVTQTMTVADLVDVVSFLQPKYDQLVTTAYGYGYPTAP